MKFYPLTAKISRLRTFKLAQLLSLLCTFSLITTINAVQASSLDAHVHGSATLTLVLEDDSLELQFSSPAMNLVGFEHEAQSKSDLAAVKHAESLLGDPKSLFLLQSGSCKHLKTIVNNKDVLKHEAHDDHNEHEKHHDHDEHSSHEAHVQHSVHRDMTSSYQYKCYNPSELEGVMVNVFSAFPGIDKIEAMWIASTQQGSNLLTHRKRLIELR